MCDQRPAGGARRGAGNVVLCCYQVAIRSSAAGRRREAMTTLGSVAPDAARRKPMTSSSLSHDILDHVSHLNALARFLARDRTLADDLVQETLLRALHHAEQFEEGTNLRA